ncbi:MAG: AbrB/MazE/SpoVT family DNA-binding domain-containing protein [Dehalococcoidales bacterium]|nr:AbrB/MazE/SpoVT family DNA-binding domain-containing protein [Dehalococcoidales bacterium]
MLQRSARITRKGQVTIPAEVRHLLGVHPHENVTFIVDKNQVRIVPAKSVVAQTAGMLKSPRPCLSPEEEENVAEDAVAEEVE